jgi:2-oxoisovalerate dehydrogenase E1 component
VLRADQLDKKALYRALLLPRTIEERMLALIRQGRLSKWFSGYGQEAVSVGCAWGLRPEDYILPAHRNLGIWTTRGVPLPSLFCQLMGKDGGFTQGRDRTFHFGLPHRRIIGMISHMAAMLPVACGLGLAAQLRRADFAALVLCGEGASREGDFHEALNLAAVWKLPVIFVVENNRWGLSTPVEEAVAVEDIACAAAGYGIRGEVVDGNDVLAVCDAVARARQAGGPSLIEAKTFRMRGHEEASGTRYVPPTLFEEWATKDPVLRFTEHVLQEGVLTQAEIDDLKRALAAEVSEAAEFALAQPEVRSTLGRERAALFAPAPPVPVVTVEARREIRFVDAVREGLWQAMEHDEWVLVMGQDIAAYGGVFKVTEGFLQRFGAERVRNTPIIESGAVGAAMGLALEGFKPVVEIQYADFITCAFNQIVDNLATTHYRWGAPLNVTVRAPFGGFIGAGPFHSQSMEAWFCHVPGLKVVVPGTPEDAKGLLLRAISDPNPVLFLEHKYLYRALKGMVPENPYEIEFGQARIAKEGRHLTIVTYGIGVLWALEEAAQSTASIEVLDLRTLIPWDKDTVLASVRKTNRLLVLHEASMTAGFGAEIAARIAEEAFDTLDAPPVRVAGDGFPIPFSTQMEKSLYSAHARLHDAVERLLAY